MKPELFTWARERAGFELRDLLRRFPKLEQWETGGLQPTIKQLEAFAKSVHVPIGYLFLPVPPNEPLPIPDFRTVEGRGIQRPSPNLLEMIYACQERQSWYREYALSTREREVEFVGSTLIGARPEDVAREMARALKFDLSERSSCSSWEEALRLFISQADRAGILVMISGVVLSNNKRRLDPDEFRGFALADKRAPLVFMNGADTKAGQMFTLAHELAHIWLGSSAISNANIAPLSGYQPEEVWCNAVAAELLVPLSALRAALEDTESLETRLSRLARRFKVSTLVILRRLLDAGCMTRAAFEDAWDAERHRLQTLAASRSSGGDFYRTTLSRVSRRFAYALVGSTLEGQTLYRDAFRMLGVAKTETFHQIGRELGVMV